MKQKSDPALEQFGPEIMQAIDTFGYELVQMKLGGRSGARALTVLIDKPGGVTAEDCRYLAKRLSVLLDAIDPIEEKYTLMVSSPGINRPLTRDEDFIRFAGENVALRWGPFEGRARSVRGHLQRVENDCAVIQTETETVQVPLAEIEAANILYDWERDDEVSNESPDDAGAGDDRQITD